MISTWKAIQLEGGDWTLESYLKLYTYSNNSSLPVIKI